MVHNSQLSYNIQHIFAIQICSILRNFGNMIKFDFGQFYYFHLCTCALYRGSKNQVHIEALIYIEVRQKLTPRLIPNLHLQMT